ncbi:sensor histidine kinase [Nannocystis radixulma]|uniref:Histidine kinase n=1 Tax=Nannocystis radixulma TaxID=2995305 RepID=A0ABT5AZG1_9BACT|nr:ATP-binding protein [Nannocystis radixulma]MDC0666337.1 histidine kinase [Nannocystis radixulma]
MTSSSGARRGPQTSRRWVSTEKDTVLALLVREESLTRRLGHGYVLALAIVALLCLAGLVLIHGVVRRHVADATLINVAGRQRMLSQKVSKLALEIERAHASGSPREASAAGAELATALAEWRDAHESLRHRPNARFPGQNSAVVAALVEAAEVHRLAITEAGSHLEHTTGDDASSLAVATILAHEREFLAAMEAIVETHERESLAGVQLIRNIESALVAASLLTLLLEALLIFRPALQLLSQTQRRLRTALIALATSERSKSALLEAVPDVVLQLDRLRVCRLVHVPANSDLPALADSAEGHSLDALLPPVAAREIEAAIARTRECEQPQRFELTLPGSDGERRHEARIALAGLDDVLVLIRDVTEQRALERDVVAAVGDERRRLGRDLHDGLCQHLAGLSLLVGSLAHRAGSEGSDPIDATALEQVGELIERALRESKQVARALHPIALEAGGIAGALDDLGHSIEALYRVPCRAEVELAGVQPSMPTATELFRIAQEAASNAARHSGATKIQIRLVGDSDQLLLTVADDGVGMGRGPASARGGGMGLRIMEHRANVLGARLRIDGNAAGGTTVCCELSVAV